MLTGILVPTSGRVRVAGLDAAAASGKQARRIGVVFGQRTAALVDLPLLDSFELLRHVYRVPAERLPRNLARFLDCSTSSRSSRRRCGSSRSASACAAS